MDEKPNHPDNMPTEPKRESKGEGCALGGLTFVGSVVAGGLAGWLVAEVFPDSLSGAGSLVPLMVFGGLLTAAIIRWGSKPGFGLGIGLTIAIPLALMGACTAIVLVSMGL